MWSTKKKRHIPTIMPIGINLQSKVGGSNSGFKQTWGNYQLVNYFLPISNYNWQLKVICPFNEYISFNSTSFDQLVCQLLLILLLLIYSNSNLMGLINYFLLDLIFLLLALYLQSGAKILEAGKFLFSF